MSTLGEYVYHASYLPDQTAGLKSIIARGLQPSADGYAGPGVYFAYDPEGGFYHVSQEEATMFRVKWSDLVAKFGKYPENENGIQRDDEQIIVPDVVPADLLEVEYFPGEWWDLKSAYHASLGPVDEAKIDNSNGRGAVPYNADVDYFGLRVAMTPSTFLELAAPLNEKDNSEMEEYIRNGGAIGAPFLDIAIPQEWDDGDFTKPAKIQGHEGRHRMKAIRAVEGDTPVEVHLFPKYYRARDLTPEFVKHINAGMYAEKSTRLIRGPLFSTGAVSEASLGDMRAWFAGKETPKPPPTRTADMRAYFDQEKPVVKKTVDYSKLEAPPNIKMILLKVQNNKPIGHAEYTALKNWYDNKKITSEAFDQPYPMKWEKGEADDSMDALVRLPDGSNLSIMFNIDYDEEGEEVIQVEFWRNNSQEVTGEGDAQKIFATVLAAIQQYIKTHKPKRLTFSASKEVEPDQNSESRAKLYDRLVMRYARTWGYRPLRADTGSIVRYELSRLAKRVTEAFDQPYAIQWTKTNGDWHATADLDDGSELIVLFMSQGDNQWMVEFERDENMEITGEGDAPRVFATVLTAMRQFIARRKPARLNFSAEKEDDPTGSRARLYDRMVQRYITGTGYNLTRQDYPGGATYTLTQIQKPVKQPKQEPAVAEDQINELGNAPADYKANRKRKNSLFHATVEGHWVDVFFDRSEFNGTLHITFTVNGDYDAPSQPTSASKSTVKILSTVLNVIKQKLPEYIKKSRPPGISFTSKQDNRTSLYRKYFVPVIQDILGTKWAHEEYPNMGMTVFHWRPVRKTMGEELNEISDELVQRYLGRADRQISRRLDRMSQARERLNKGYEIYDVNNPTKIIDRFEANTPAQAEEYYYKFIKGYNPGDENFEFGLRRSTGIPESVTEDQDYMAGHCHVMALALKRIHPDWQIRAHVGWDDEEAEDEDYRVDHVYAVAPDGSAYDCRGRFDSEEALVGEDVTGGVDTQYVDFDLADIKQLVQRGELKSFTMQDIEQATQFAKQMMSEHVMEGGWSSVETQNTIITPRVVVEIVETLKGFEKSYNAWQAKNGFDTEIKIGNPKGSATYYRRDLVNDPEREYGDVDIECFIHSREGLKSAQRITEYKMSVTEYCLQSPDYSTENGTNLVMRTTAGPVQVDLLYTYHEHADWSRALSPEYRVKGVISTSLTSALAEVLNLSFSSQGIQVKIRNNQPVSFRQSKDTELRTVSLNPENWAKDVYSLYYYLAHGEKPTEFPGGLEAHSGLKDEQRLSDIVLTIKSLANALEESNMLGHGALIGIPSKQDLIRKVATVYSEKLETAEHSSKFDKAQTPAAQEKAKKTKLMLAKYRNEITKLLLN